MSEALPAELQARSHDLGPHMEPALDKACDGRLSDVHWFRTSWQRGGAATAYAKVVVVDDEPARDVVIKLPVGPREYLAATAMAADGLPGPGIAFHGLELGGWDLAWLVMERLPGDPLAADLSKQVFVDLAETAAAYYKRAGELWEIRPPRTEWDWETLLHQARESAQINPIPDAPKWANLVKDTHRALDHLLDTWHSRPINSWCHGDLHPGNLMRRPEGSPWGTPCPVLLDYAESHCGHWVEDAVYIERLFWGKPELLHGAKPVSLLAKARRKLGLDTSDDYALYANVRRVLMAAVAPAFVHREGHPKYMHAALEMLEKNLPIVVKQV